LKKLLVLVAFSVLLLVPVSAFGGSSIIVSDDTFNDSDWTLTTIADTNPGATTVTAGQSLTGGNPEAYRAGQHDWGPGTIFIANLENNFAHDPSTQGAIESLDCSLDFNVFNVSLSGGAVNIAITLFQDETYYRSVQAFTIFEFSGWVPLSFNDISFLKVSGPGPSIPDLSSTGGVIKLGYVTANTTGSHRISDFGVDNFQCTLNLSGNAETLKIIQTTTGADGTFGFTVTGPTSFTTNISTVGGTGMDGPTTVNAGTYSIQQSTILQGWSLPTAFCNDGSSTFSVDTVSGIVIDSDDEIECTFDNVYSFSKPKIVAVNEVTKKVYVANEGDSSIRVIDGTTNIPIGFITVGDKPKSIAINEVTNTIYTANDKDNTVSIIDGSTDTLSATITVGAKPKIVAVNEVTNKAYVANEADKTISVIDGSTNTVIATIGVGDKPKSIAISEATNTIYVTNDKDNTVSIIDGSTDTLIITLG